MTEILNWLSSNWVELFASVLAFIGIFLQIKQNAWYWFTSIIVVSLYIYVFFISGFYADMAFQFYYLIVSVYGWYFWITGKNKNKKTEVKTRVLTNKQWIYSIVVFILLYALIYTILTNLTDSQIAEGDAFTTSLSFVATWLLARKILENWLFWIVVDVVSTGMYVYKGLYPTAILFTALSILAVVGFIQWRKTYKNEQENKK